MCLWHLENELLQVREHEDYKELYDEVEAEIKALPPPILS